jgi:hypothetical protein
MRDPGSCDQRYTGPQSGPRQARFRELDPLPVTGTSPGSGRLGLLLEWSKHHLLRNLQYGYHATFMQQL